MKQTADNIKAVHSCISMYNTLSYCRGAAQWATAVEILSTAAQMYQKILSGKSCNRWM